MSSVIRDFDLFKIRSKEMIAGLNKHFDNRIKLGAMALLMVQDKVDFLTLKEELGASDGNLASHLSTLEKLEYIVVEKDFVGKKTRTRYQATKFGRLEFSNHLTGLENLMKQMK
jgi:hypothetical protein